MDFNIKLSAKHTQIVVDQLDLGIHKDVRPVIDILIAQVREQEKEAQKLTKSDSITTTEN